MIGEGASFGNLGLRPGESVEFIVRGNCMRGLERDASIPVRKQRLYWPGDVIVVRRLGHWNAHRFLGYAPSARGLLALTAADSAAARDPAATLDAIVGRADCGISASDRIGAVAKYARALLRHVAKVRR